MICDPNDQVVEDETKMMTTRTMPLVDYELIEATAPGKIILIGEFSDLYEKNSIAMAINPRMKVSIRPHKEGRLRLNLKNFSNIREWPTTSFTLTKLVGRYADILDYSDRIPAKLNHLLHRRYYQGASSESDSGPGLITKQSDDSAMAFLILYVALGDAFAKSARPGIDVEVESEIPIGKGLGSSSAYAVALCAALMKVFRVSAEPYIINSWTLNIDKFFHGNASGLASGPTIHGGYLYFQHNKVKSQGIEHSSPVRVMLIDTGIQRETKIVNEMIAELVAEDSERMNNLFMSIGDLASQAWRKINDPNFAPKSISSLLITNQEYLDSLGVGHEILTEICTKAVQLKLAVKQTHCGQTAFLLYDELDSCSNITELRHFLTQKGLKYQDYYISFKGLEINITPNT